jgi:hypothetical protein
MTERKTRKRDEVHEMVRGRGFQHQFTSNYKRTVAGPEGI